jgi:lipopolysaccharide transport system ATP-binding protein
LGEANLRGRVGSLLEVGTGFHQELTGRENIYLNGAILGMKRREINKKFDEIVDFSGVEKFLDTPVKHYSSGMYMRLAFAVAANLESEILIIDEVLAVGDVEFQEKCLGKMSEITNNEGRTILFVSHNLEAVKKLCSRCILLDRGSKAFDGSVENALTKYNKTQKDIDLSENKYRSGSTHHGSGSFRFTSINMLDETENKRNVYKAGEKMKFKIAYEICENVEGLYLEISMLSSKIKGLVLTSMRHEIKNGTLKKGENGIAVIEVKLSGIRPGEYILNYCLRDKISMMQYPPVHYDIIENITKPLIIEARTENEKRLPGIFSLPSKVG